MEDTHDETDLAGPLYDRLWDSGVAMEIWPCSPAVYKVKVTSGFRRARWWQWWRSDLPFPRSKHKDIINALEHARTWLGNKADYRPCYLELKLYLIKSDVD